MKTRTLFLIVALLTLLTLAASNTYAFKHYRTDYGRYEESKHYTLEYDFRHLRKQFNAADEQGKVAIIKTVFKEGWVLENYHFDEEGQLSYLTDSRGAFDNKTLKEQDLLNLSPESRYEILLAAKEIIASDKKMHSYHLWQGSAPERMKIFALWMKNAKSIEKDQEFKSFVKEYLTKSTDNRDDVIACYLAYCNLSDDEFNQITTAIVSDMKNLINRSKPMSDYDLHLPLIQKIAYEKLLPEKNVTIVVETLGELFAEISPYETEAVFKKKSRLRRDWLGNIGYVITGDVNDGSSAVFGGPEPDRPEVIGYKHVQSETNLELAKTLKVIARKYRTLKTQIDEMLKNDAIRRKNYDKKFVDK